MSGVSPPTPPVVADHNPEMEEARRQLAEILEECDAAFGYQGDAVSLDPPIRFALNYEATPHLVCKRTYSHTPEEMAFLDEFVADQLEKGACYPWFQPTTVCSPIFAVGGEPGGPRRRAVIDFQTSGVNGLLADAHFPLPVYAQVLLRLAGCKLFSLLDVEQAFHQLPIDEEVQVYTTFQHRGSLYRWTRLVEGLKPASAHCQAAITQLLQLDLEQGAALYTDDLLLFHRTWREHLACLRRILQRAIRAGLRFKRSKCEFLMQVVFWLGRYISEGTVHPPYNYLQKVLDKPRPSTVSGVRSWCSAVSWVIEHLPGVQLLMAPIHALVKVETLQAQGERLRGGKVPKSAPVSWTQEACDAFTEVCRLCADPSTLQIPDVSRPFAVRCDGSGVGWGAVLLQRDWAHPDEGPWRPVSFAGGKWASKRETQAPPRTLEMGAMRHALTHWAYLLRNGKEVRVFSDHASLSQSISPLPHDAEWVRRIVGDLLQWPLHITYVRGEDMGIPDVISRHPPPPPEQPVY